VVLRWFAATARNTGIAAHRDRTQLAPQPPATVKILAPGEVTVTLLLDIEPLNRLAIGLLSHLGRDHFDSPFHQPRQGCGTDPKSPTLQA
jgi:hypothetical protein